MRVTTFPPAPSGHEARVQTREIGNDQVGRVQVGAIGLGLMTFDQTGTQPREQLADTVRAALDAGVTLFDTADAYGPGDELGAGRPGRERAADRRTARRARRPRPGAARHQGRPRPRRRRRRGTSTAVRDHLGRPSTRACSGSASSRSRCGSTTGPTPTSTTPRCIDTLKEIHASGKVRMIGLSNADPDQIRPAHEVLGDALVSVQNQFSPAYRSSRPEIDVCEELGLAFLPWSPLGGLTTPRSWPTSTRRSTRSPTARGVSAQQVALAWELAQSPGRDPDPGREAAAVDHRLRGGRRPRAHRRRGRPARRRLTGGPARALTGCSQQVPRVPPPTGVML